jgi:CRISPR-associated protein Cmr4
MFKLAKPFFITVETPLHAGSGSDLGVVDLPIQRERHTGIPKVEASGLKGCVREAFEKMDMTDENQRFQDLGTKFPGISNPVMPGKSKSRFEQAIELVFGPDSGDLHAGALAFTDARLVLFPVRSACGLFAWITCPAVLHKFVHELELAGITKHPKVPEANTVPLMSNNVCQENVVILEEYTFTVTLNDDTEQLAIWLAAKIFPIDGNLKYWHDKMLNSLVVLGDDDFRDFVNLSTEVITRIKINPQTGTVQEGALFNEEYLPQESVLYSLALASTIFTKHDKGIFANSSAEEKDVLDFWHTGMPSVLQLGGNATIGKGIVRINVIEEG